MIISLAIVAMISAVCGSAMVFATRSIEAGYASPGAAGTAARNATDWMCDDLKVATAFTEQTAAAVTMIVPDRTGDGAPETIRYAWSGAAGSTINGFAIPAYCVTRELNGSNPLVVVGNAKTFSLTYDTRDVGPQPPKESAETVLVWHEGASGANEVLTRLDDKSFVGQTVKPVLLHNAQAWSITKVRMKLQRYASSTGTVTAELHATDSSGLATGGSLGNATLSAATFPATADWVTFTFSTPITGLDLSSSYAVVVSGKPGHGVPIAYVVLDNTASDTSQISATSDTADDHWTAATSTSAMQAYIYGTQTTQDPS